MAIVVHLAEENNLDNHAIRAIRTVVFVRQLLRAKVPRCRVLRSVGSVLEDVRGAPEANYALCEDGGQTMSAKAVEMARATRTRRDGAQLGNARTVLRARNPPSWRFCRRANSHHAPVSSSAGDAG